jgi:hypothetical protein
MQLYLDMDGVLADFDKRAEAILQMKPSLFEEKYGAKAFWMILQDSFDFYNSFPMMIDAPSLLDAVDHLNPIVLTGVPLGEWAAPQKRAWLKRHVPGYPVITCRAKDKSNYCKPGDVIVDDRIEHRHLWCDKGGQWVHHTSAYDSIEALKNIGVLS